MDLKGRAGIILLEGSRSFKTGKPYRFLRGGIEDFKNLPPAKGLPKAGEGNAPTCGSKRRPPHAHKRAWQRRKGTFRDDFPGHADSGRNPFLFWYGLRVMRGCADLDTLMGALQRRNVQFLASLPDTEIADLAAKLWRNYRDSRNWAGGESRVAVTLSMTMDYANSPGALWFRGYLRHNHAARKEPFAICYKAVAAALGKGHETIARYTEELIRRGELEEQQSQLEQQKQSQTAEIATFAPKFLDRRQYLLEKLPATLQANLTRGGGSDPAGRAAVTRTRLQIQIELQDANAPADLVRLKYLYGQMAEYYSALFDTEVKIAQTEKDIAHTITDEKDYATGGGDGGDGGGGNGGGN